MNTMFSYLVAYRFLLPFFLRKRFVRFRRLDLVDAAFAESIVSDGIDIPRFELKVQQWNASLNYKGQPRNLSFTATYSFLALQFRFLHSKFLILLF